MPTGYIPPTITDLGPLGTRTFLVGDGNDNIKGGGDPQHVDSHCEWSGGTDPDYSCTDVTDRP